jgi:hypothetical protein
LSAARAVAGVDARVEPLAGSGRETRVGGVCRPGLEVGACCPEGKAGRDGDNLGIRVWSCGGQYQCSHVDVTFWDDKDEVREKEGADIGS